MKGQKLQVVPHDLETSEETFKTLLANARTVIRELGRASEIVDIGPSA